MLTSRPITHRTVTAAAAATLLAASGLIAWADQANSAAELTRPETLNRMEHEAHRYLSEVRQEQARSLNPREHLAHRDLAGAEPATAANAASASTPTLGPCASTLARAWQQLGHFSDGYESYLLRQAPCSTTSGTNR